MTGVSADVHARVRGLSDEEFFSMLLRSVDARVVQGTTFPSFPDDQLQANFVGSSGKDALNEAYNFWRVLKSKTSALGRPLGETSNVLDFGCGWGRYLRFLNKDTRADHLHGVDVNPEIVALCKRLGVAGNVKAIEALGRLRASAANPVLQTILAARQVWRWQYPSELRVAAGQALLRIDPVVAMGKISAAGFEKRDLVLEPIDPETNSSVIRQRRYARLKLSRNLTLMTTNLRENFRLTVPELNLGGGIGAGERHLAPGTLIGLKLTQGVRTIKAQAIVRGARPQAMAFEFVDMELEDRARLRKILLELGGLPQASNVASRTRRRGRIAVLK